MRTAPPKYKFIAAALICLLVVWLLPKALRPALHAAGLSVDPGTVRPALVVLLFAVLGSVLVWSSVAKRSFQLALPFDKQARDGLVVSAASFLAFLVYCFFVFSLNDSFLLWQMDGRRFEYLVRQQSVWFPFYTGYTNDFFHSLGNIWYPLNMKLDPGFLLATDHASGALDRRLSYLIFSTELYLSTFLLGMVLRQGIVISSVAGWLIVVLAMPIHGLPAIYPIFAMAPNYPIAQTLVMLCLFRQIGRVSDGWSAALLVAAVLLIAHAALSHPTAVILMAPVLLIFSTFILWASDTRRELAVKLACAVAGVGLLAIAGFPRYLAGMFEYSVPYYFSSELFNDRAFFYFVSIAFQRSNPGLALFLLALLGAALVARGGGRFESRFACGLLAAMAVLTGAGALTVGFVNLWRGPSPLYFEFFLWPIYAVFAAAGLRVLYYACRTAFHPGLEATAPMDRGLSYLLVVLLLCIPCAFYTYLNPRLTPAPDQFHVTQTRIVSLLKDEVGLKPGSLFRGRVATLTGQALPVPANWHDLNSLDHVIHSRSGNSHQSIGLWIHNIPTLFELSSLITPPFFLVTREFLEKPGDVQMRNALVLRRFDARVLRALGVRYVVTDAPLDGDAVLRISEATPLPSTHYLYEISGANRGDFSPTVVVPVANVKSTLATLADPHFDFARTVVLEAPLPVKLVSARASEVRVEAGHFRVRAASEGTSLLLLPFEFSHCLSLKAAGGEGGKAKLLRANLVHTGILFSGDLDATITFFTGPFENSGCRIQDRKDMDRLQIRQVRRDIVLPRPSFPGL